MIGLNRVNRDKCKTYSLRLSNQQKVGIKINRV
jgi:hypothetical protein